MTLKQIAALGRKLVSFLTLFDDCFRRRKGADLLRTYVKGQLSDIHRKTAEAIALSAGRPPRTLQRFLQSVKWDEEKLRDRCQHIVATEHAHPEAIGCIDESGTAKSGHDTVGVGRQYNGNRGKIENCVVGVHLGAKGATHILDGRRRVCTLCRELLITWRVESLKGTAMARMPRKSVVDDDEVGVYHCINRCVRRAFLCGTDSITGQCFDHRKQWI